MHSQSFRYAHQTATNTVRICIVQTWLETISHAFHSLNSYSLTHYSHSSIGQYMHNQSFRYVHQTATNTVSIGIEKNLLNIISHAYHSSTYIHLRTILIHQLDSPCIFNHSSMHIKQSQILLASVEHRQDYMIYDMHSIFSTHIHLRPTLIHQLDNPCIVNH
jgi:hypothetical protein